MPSHQGAVQQLLAGLAPYLDEEIWVYIRQRYRRVPESHGQFNSGGQYSWLIRAATNYLLYLGQSDEFVLGVLVVFEHAVELHAFTCQFELAQQVCNHGASATLRIYATKSVAENGQPIWVVKVVQAQSVG